MSLLQCTKAPLGCVINCDQPKDNNTSVYCLTQHGGVERHHPSSKCPSHTSNHLLYPKSHQAESPLKIHLRFDSWVSFHSTSPGSQLGQETDMSTVTTSAGFPATRKQVNQCNLLKSHSSVEGFANPVSGPYLGAGSCWQADKQTSQHPKLGPSCLQETVEPLVLRGLAHSSCQGIWVSLTLQESASNYLMVLPLWLYQLLFLSWLHPGPWVGTWTRKWSNGIWKHLILRANSLLMSIISSASSQQARYSLPRPRPQDVACGVCGVLFCGPLY